MNLGTYENNATSEQVKFRRKEGKGSEGLFLWERKNMRIHFIGRVIYSGIAKAYNTVRMKEKTRILICRPYGNKGGMKIV